MSSGEITSMRSMSVFDGAMCRSGISSAPGSCLERGVFCSLDELTNALEEWIKLWNEGARPFK